MACLSERDDVVKGNVAREHFERVELAGWWLDVIGWKIDR